jgi:KAP family P-loop domain
MADYSMFKVLLDDPATQPGLGFPSYASAFAEIIEHSKAQFAIGIFGDWGSGKTTLMRAIQRQLDTHDDVVTVWFNAWRYEKESHLIVPLLDTLREELVVQAESPQVSPADAGLARRAAAAVGRAGKALLAGVTLSAGLPGLGVTLEPGKVLADLQSEPHAAEEALSFYHVGFNMLRDAINEFSQHGAWRVVVFVDDLDRCLPENALDVLESIKLFFDMEGFVFVVGLDQSVVERAIALKYPLADSTGAPIDGTAYVKKVFQVPFGLPRIGTDQLQEYLEILIGNADIPFEQRDDFDVNVRRHLEFLPGEDSINPREVKRLVNAYTLQLKMLSPRLGILDPDIVLALQNMSFRPDWADLYEHLVADPDLFQKAIKEAREAPNPRERDAVWMSGVKVPLPVSFQQYIDADAHALLDTPSLRLYVSAAEATRSTDPSLLDAQSIVGRIRRVIDDVTTGNTTLRDAASSMSGDTRRLLETTRRRSAQKDLDLETLIKQLDGLASQLIDTEAPAEDAAAGWAAKTVPLLDLIDGRLREMRRQTNVGASTA